MFIALSLQVAQSILIVVINYSYFFWLVRPHKSGDHLAPERSSSLTTSTTEASSKCTESASLKADTDKEGLRQRHLLAEGSTQCSTSTLCPEKDPEPQSQDSSSSESSTFPFTSFDQFFPSSTAGVRLLTPARLLVMCSKLV